MKFPFLGHRRDPDLPSTAEVGLEFVRVLNETVAAFEETLVPVLRGSLLLRYWFGDKARHAADVDLECFERPRDVPLTQERMEYFGEGHGAWGEYQSLVDLGKAMCRYAAESTIVYAAARRQRPMPDFSFQQCDSPDEGGHDLWAYGTPGERYFTNWTAHRHRGATGKLQIDIAEPGSYAREDLALCEIELAGPNQPADGTVLCPAYTPEMLLAAKLSWLLRSLSRRLHDGNIVAPCWMGELKDLFDVHLLLTAGQLDAEPFQKSLLAVGTEDDLDWSRLDVLFDIQRAEMQTADFAGWDRFAAEHGEVITCEPPQMLATVAEKLEPLLDEFYLRDELPLIAEIQANPADEVGYAIYADWLEEHGSPRAVALRLFQAVYFADKDVPAEELIPLRAQLQQAFQETSQPWLQTLFGSASRLRDKMSQIAE